ncbi:hypothetical protein C8Q72DRAFT_522252 [Fomitopsis betulina]|nr:hypothetical protein C8Q72DRAFT_522252 [Fomitopsis betulina]
MSRTPDPQPSAQSPNHSSITASSHPLSSGTVGGIVIGVVAVVLIVVLTILYAYGWLPRWCRRSSYPSRKEGMDIVLDDMPKSPPPPVGMDAFRKLLIQNAQHAAMVRLHSGPNSKKSSSKKSSSNRTQSTAIFSSVVILSPPVSSSGGSHSRSEIRPPPRALQPQRPTTPILSLHVTN